ncbi:hypothetical protein [Bacillus sp. V5-8f]|uniref:hypothetical protein n=1 Tax=Bacillus sp. V5-8f TaxID=2053044 RepID=UPI000C787538|nr:hypothetical protein [Bacillus sp. V5-8f]PLT33474.1 hypothetical protein CUU64_12920 [Bacillus sp. V5-8f]
MEKISTKLVQSNLLRIGKELGFEVKEEYRFEQLKGMYTPRYDVIWLLNVSGLDVQKVLNIPLVDHKYVPFAAFEIEGSTTTSKNQLGNFGNLKLSPCYYNFIVVNNASAAKENDTYRRAMKIVRTMQRLMGERPLFLFDACMLVGFPTFESICSFV